MLRLLLVAVLALGASASPAQAPSTPATNPQIDYQGFERLTGTVGPYRQKRLLSWAQFAAAANKPGALLLDARSTDAFAAGHIAGAVNLPFTDFTAASLARVIGDPNRPIFIYCNNNFANDEPPVMKKAIEVALNIQTFINLVGYGYRDVWELNEVVDFDDPKVGWVSGKAVAGGSD